MVFSIAHTLKEIVEGVPHRPSSMELEVTLLVYS